MAKELTNYYEVTGGLCVQHKEPCPEIGCRYHLHSDAKPDQIAAAPTPMVTCTLKLANRGCMTLEEVGIAMGITRERVRQIERTGVLHMGRVLHRQGFTPDVLLHFQGSK